MIGTDVWSASDDAFEVYLSTISWRDLSRFEWELYRHHKLMAKGLVK